MAVVKPIITYALVIWWEKAKQVTTQTKLNKLQKLAIASLTEAMHNKPSKAGGNAKFSFIA